MEFKYEVGYEFYLMSSLDVFHKTKILDRQVIEYETRPSKVFYLLEIENKDNDWYSENFINACALTKEEMDKRKGD